MLIGMWNYAIKARDIDRTTDFYVQQMGASLRLHGIVFGCRYNLIRMGRTRVIIFAKAPYEEAHGLDLPPGFLHVVYEVDNHEEHVAMLAAAGCRFLIEPQEIETALGRRKIAFFEAPDGMRTEVMQVLEDWEDQPQDLERATLDRTQAGGSGQEQVAAS